jgi:hypothetical protein
MGLKPTFVDLNRQRPDQPEATLRVRKDPDHMGPALELLIEAFEHIGAFEMFMMFLGESVKRVVTDKDFCPAFELRTLFVVAHSSWLGRVRSFPCAAGLQPARSSHVPVSTLVCALRSCGPHRKESGAHHPLLLLDWRTAPGCPGRSPATPSHASKAWK